MELVSGDLAFQRKCLHRIAQFKENGCPIVLVSHDATLAPEPINAPIVSVTVSREDGFVCYDTSTAAAGIDLATLQGKGEINLYLDRLDLIAGEYFVDVGIFEQNWAYAYDYHWHVYPYTVTNTGSDKGIVRPPHRWQIGYGAPAAVPELFQLETASK